MAKANRFGRERMLLMATVFAGIAACDAGDGADIQPLPASERPSPEARAGLPEISGRWRFAGWDLAVVDTSAAVSGLPVPGDLVLETQRLDSLAGIYVEEDNEIPLVGEVRRDGVVALVAGADDGPGRFIAGHLRDDTLWIELTSLEVSATLPPQTRLAFVRDSILSRFVRLSDGTVIRIPTDTFPEPPPPELAPRRRSLPETIRGPERRVPPSVRLDTGELPPPDALRPPPRDTLAMRYPISGA